MPPNTALIIFVIVVIIVIALILALGAVLWWLLVATEGVYLGQRVVVWLYDLYARRYDDIKQYDAAWERSTLGDSIRAALAGVPHPLILDVATGTARLPLALLSGEPFDGHLIALDASRQMLRMAAAKLDALPRGHEQVLLVRQDAERLPLEDATFDCVCCLEALEFVAHPRRVLAELVRVAKPGALLVLTNRKGWQTLWMPFKTQTTRRFTSYLRQQLGLEDVTVTLWQMDYDLIYAFKPGLLPATQAVDLLRVLRCPAGHAALTRHVAGLRCRQCGAIIMIGADRVLEYPR